MPYDVQHDERAAHIDVRYSGCVSIAERTAAMNETLAVIRGHGPCRILIDFDQARLHDVPLAAQSAFATVIATRPELRPCRIAFVGHERNGFNTAIETLSAGRGYRFRRFFDRDTALAWLAAAPIASAAAE